MEKKNFITLLMGVVGGMLFALGMCMCLLTEWGAFNQGIGFGIVGLVVLVITYIKYRKDCGKEPIKFDIKTIGKIVYGFISALVMGVGMCMTMVFEGMMIQGIIVGIIGIVMVLCLIPMCFGWKESK